MSALEQLFREELAASWKAGHAAAMDEMNDPTMSGIKGYHLIYHAISKDRPLTQEEVKIVWDDAFLTNVIVPILEHIKRHDNEMVNQAIINGEAVQEYYYSRRMVDLDHVQDILREWRG